MKKLEGTDPPIELDINIPPELTTDEAREKLIEVLRSKFISTMRKLVTDNYIEHLRIDGNSITIEYKLNANIKFNETARIEKDDSERSDH